MNKRLLVIALISTTVAHALPLDIEGGSGLPVSVTLGGKIEYSITRSYTDMEMVFVFRAIGLTDFASGTAQTVSNSLYFTINNDPYHYQLKNTLGTRFESLTAINFTSITPITVNLGDVITLWGGSTTTIASNYGAPANGLNFDTYLMARGQPNPAALTGVYSTVPEPSTFAALAGLATLTLAATRRRART